jgi:hypothetical protein
MFIIVSFSLFSNVFDKVFLKSITADLRSKNLIWTKTSKRHKLLESSWVDSSYFEYLKLKKIQVLVIDKEFIFVRFQATKIKGEIFAFKFCIFR